MKPYRRRAGASIKGEDNRAFVAISHTDALVGDVKNRGAVFVLCCLEGQGGSSDLVVNFFTGNGDGILFAHDAWKIVFVLFFFIFLGVEEGEKEREYDKTHG